MRLGNRLIHGYRTIDLEIVHTTADAQLPGFIGAIRAVMDSLEPN